MSFNGTDFKVHKIINGNYLFSYDGFNYTLMIENKYQRIKYKTRELYKLFKDTPYIEILDSCKESNGNIRELPNGLIVYMDFSKKLNRKHTIKYANLKVGKMIDSDGCLDDHWYYLELLYEINDKTNYKKIYNFINNYFTLGIVEPSKYIVCGGGLKFLNSKYL